MREYAIGAALIVLLTSSTDAAETLTMDAVNAAQFDANAMDTVQPGAVSPLILKTQILLDRNAMSPGVIDGRFGENVSKALDSFAKARKLDSGSRLDEKAWNALGGGSSGDVLMRYKITKDDLKGPFVGPIPGDYKKMSEMERLAYRSPAEMFGERFHMDIDLLNSLNPDIGTATEGAEIIVANVGTPAKTTVKSIRINKSLGQLHGLDADGKLVVAYPATIGSRELPSPSGTHTIKAIAFDAAYYYRPDENFTADGIKEKLTLPPGPNNPIGTTWIDLDKPTYGIHGTPEPAEIDKEASHGCVRLTNWDVEELAGLVEPGVEVAFVK